MVVMLLPGVCAVQCDSNMLLLLSRVVPPTPTTLTPRGQPAADDITTLRRLESLNVCWQRLSGCAPWLGLSERPHNDVNCAKSKPWARSWQRRRPVKRWEDSRDMRVTIGYVCYFHVNCFVDFCLRRKGNIANSGKEVG